MKSFFSGRKFFGSEREPSDKAKTDRQIFTLTRPGERK